MKIFSYILYWLRTGCQCENLPISPDPIDPDNPEISYYRVYYHYRKWSLDGSLENVWIQSIDRLAQEQSLDLSHLNLDGTHTIAKKGRPSAVYQRRSGISSTINKFQSVLSPE